MTLYVVESNSQSCEKLSQLICKFNYIDVYRDIFDRTVKEDKVRLHGQRRGFSRCLAAITMPKCCEIESLTGQLILLSLVVALCLLIIVKFCTLDEIAYIGKFHIQKENVRLHMTTNSSNASAHWSNQTVCAYLTSCYTLPSLFTKSLSKIAGKREERCYTSKQVFGSISITY